MVVVVVVWWWWRLLLAGHFVVRHGCQWLRGPPHVDVSFMREKPLTRTLLQACAWKHAVLHESVFSHSSGARATKMHATQASVLTLRAWRRVPARRPAPVRAIKKQPETMACECHGRTRRQSPSDKPEALQPRTNQRGFFNGRGSSARACTAVVFLPLPLLILIVLPHGLLPCLEQLSEMFLHLCLELRVVDGCTWLSIRNAD